MPVREWVRLPCRWIEQGGLREFRWRQHEGANHAAALMILIAASHLCDRDTGNISLTYDRVHQITGLSRLKISRGIDVLLERNLLEFRPGRSMYYLSDFSSTPWAKIPYKAMIRNNGEIRFFHSCHLRNKNELNAIKIFLLLASRRDDELNGTKLSYDKISLYSGIDRSYIRSALDLLINHSLIRIDGAPSDESEYGIVNIYRIAGVDPYVHAGTRGRALENIFTGDW